MHYLTRSLITLILITFAACSASKLPRNTPPEVAAADASTVEAKYAASDLGAHELAEIRFTKGSYRLDEKSRKRIDDLIEKASQSGKIEEVKVVTWADREFPSRRSRKLPKDDRDLAESRAKAIKELVKEKTSGVAVDEYNMAIYPNAVERLLNTSDYRVKKSLEESGISQADRRAKGPSMKGKAIVMILLERESH